jgi:hypothetical protein
MEVVYSLHVRCASDSLLVAANVEPRKGSLRSTVGLVVAVHFSDVVVDVASLT